MYISHSTRPSRSKQRSKPLHCWVAVFSLWGGFNGSARTRRMSEVKGQGSRMPSPHKLATHHPAFPCLFHLHGHRSMEGEVESPGVGASYGWGTSCGHGARMASNANEVKGQGIFTIPYPTKWQHTTQRSVSLSSPWT